MEAIKFIPVNVGHFAIVDKFNYDDLSKYTWALSSEYAARRFKDKIEAAKEIHGAFAWLNFPEEN